MEPVQPSIERGSNGSRYQHKSLHRSSNLGLRLLKVLPSRLDGLIQVELWQSNGVTEYRCLSYMCGEPSDDHEISLEGCIFFVRKNLYDFLELASERYPEEPLWIDALSIDQSNDAEKAGEVRRMNVIYTGAAEVLVWLGVMDLPRAAIRWVTEQDAVEPSSLVVNTFNAVGSMDYWNRTWVTQEILLAKQLTILIGRHSFHWTDFGPPALRALGTLSSLYQLAFFWQRWTYTQSKHVDGSTCNVRVRNDMTLPFWDLFS